MASTGPSHATMMTGLYPLSHGVLKNGFALSEVHETLAERLKARGYATAAVLSSFPLDARFGLAQGFDLYDDDLGERQRERPRHWNDEVVEGAFSRDGADTAELASDWLRSRPQDRPFFLWVHLFDPHAPYDLRAELRDRVRPAATAWPDDERAQKIWSYDSEVRYADLAMGQVLDTLDALGLRERTLVALVGDHGEGLGDHGRMGHGLTIYDETLRVPLVFRLPARVKAGLEITGPIPLVDLLPTILELALGQKAQGFQGESLVPALAGRSTPRPDRKIFVQRRQYSAESQAEFKIRGDKFALRLGPWKYLVAEDEGTRELYDLREDPKELRNVAEGHARDVAALDAALQVWRRGQKTTVGPKVSPEDAERLRALGYVQ